MKESLTVPEGVTLVDPGKKSFAQIARDLILSGKPVIVAGVDHTDFRRKVWILQATDIDLKSMTLNGYKGWQYRDQTTFRFVDTDAGEYGDNIDLPTIYLFVAEVDEGMLEKTVDENELMDIIDYALMHVTISAPEVDFPPILETI